MIYARVINEQQRALTPVEAFVNEGQAQLYFSRLADHQRWNREETYQMEVYTLTALLMLNLPSTNIVRTLQDNDRITP